MKATTYRGFRIEAVPDDYDEDDVWYYVHHPARAADLGASMSMEGAKKIVDDLHATKDPDSPWPWVRP